MKRTVFLILTVTLALNLNAQKPTATFFSENGQKFWIVMDGKRMNPEAQYRVENIPMENDWAKVKIIFEDASIPPIEKTIQCVDADGNKSSVTWAIKQNGKGKWQVKPSSWKAVSPSETDSQSAALQQQQSEQQPATNTSKTTTQTTTVNTTQQPENTNVTVNSGESNISMNVSVTDPNTNTNPNMGINVVIPGTGTVQNQSSQTTTTITTVTTTNEQPVQQPSQQPAQIDKPNPLPGYNGRVGCNNNPMTPERFSDAKKSITSKSFEDSKLTIAKQIMNANCLLVSQVKEIMGLFTYEDTKLTFAKEAYSHTYNIDDYYQLNDAFTL